jgi:plasmid stabilization system protein ParE
MKTYVLSQEAEADVSDIFDYSEHEFGFEQAGANPSCIT